MQLPPAACLYVVCTISVCVCFVSTSAGLFQNTLCPCQSRTASGPWGHSETMAGLVACECVKCLSAYRPGKCPCGSRGRGRGASRASRCPLWCRCSGSPPGRRTTRARIVGGCARSTWRGWSAHLGGINISVGTAPIRYLTETPVI